jgi:hypothetical protein
MSDYTAIAGVSRSIRSLLQDRMENQVDVTIAPPDVEVTGMTSKRLNLYLFKVSENGFLKNQEIPGQGHPSSYGHPPLSLDLHYLLTAHGSKDTAPDGDLEAQQILGDAMRVLHDFPIITPSLYEDDDDTKPRILDTSLVGEFERVKIVLQPMSLEDLSKLWAAMHEANFRRSVAYHVSVVQIESQRARRYPRPVGEPEEAGPRVYALPFRSPRIEEIRVIRQDDADQKERPYPYARIGDTLVIYGSNFASESTRVLLGSAEATATVKDTRIEATIPDDGELQPGPQPVQVVLDVKMGEPAESHMGFYSNLAVFMLVPHITQLSASSGTLSIEGTRLFDDELNCMTLVGRKVVHEKDYTTKTETEIAFSIPAGLDSGDHAVRVRVNGAESIDSKELTIP